MDAKIRPIEARDEPRRRELRDGYARHLGARIMDPEAPVHAIVAERAADGIVGMANDLLHETRSRTAPFRRGPPDRAVP